MKTLRSLTAVQRRLLDWMKGASHADWVWIYRFEYLQRNMYVFDREKMKCMKLQDSGEKIPWPIVWLAARHHTKHIFMREKMPSMERCLKEVRLLRDKVAWRWYHRNSDASMPMVSVREKRSTPPFRHMLAPELELWTKSLGMAVCRAYAVARSSAEEKNYRNVLPVIKKAMRYLRDENITLMKNDKDGGFTVMTKEDRTFVHEQCFAMRTRAGPIYEELTPDMIFESNWRKEYRRLAAEISEFEGDEKLKAAILASEPGPNYSVMMSLVKTHKPELAFRPVHCSASHRYKGVSQWLALTIRKRMRHCRHLVKNSAEFVKEFCSMSNEERQGLYVSVDIKNFFLSGTLEELVETIAPAFEDPEERRLVVEATRFLLDVQLVTSPYHKGRGWKVKQGTSMGMIHSSELADYALYLLAEDQWMTDPEQASDMRLKRIWRFRDDLLLLFEDAPAIYSWWPIFEKRCKYYQAELISVSHRNFVFLGIEADVDVVHGSVQIKPYTKPTKVGFPLDASSCHAAHIHLSWPRDGLRSILGRSSSQEIALRARQQYIDRFRYHMAHPEIIEMLERTPFEWPPRERVREEKVSPNLLWLAAGYHPALIRPLRRELASFNTCKWMSRVFAEAYNGIVMPPQVRLSWYNSVRNLESELQAI